MAWTTLDFLNDVKLKGFLPDSGNMTDAEMLRVGDGEIRTKIIPLIVGAEQEFWIDYQDYTYDTSLTEIRIPSQALLGRVRDVTMIDPEGNESDPINRVPIERFGGYSRSNIYNGWSGMFFTVRGDKILLPQATNVESGWSIRVYYYRRPSQMVATTAAMAVTGVVGNQLTGSPPGSFTTSTYLDVVQAQPNFDVLRVNSLPSSVSGGVTFSTATDDAATGDYVSLTGTTPIVPVPDLCYELLVSATVYQVLKITGFYEQAAFERDELTKSMANIVTILAPRVKSPSAKVINRYGPLRNGR